MYVLRHSWGWHVEILWCGLHTVYDPEEQYIIKIPPPLHSVHVMQSLVSFLLDPQRLHNVVPEEITALMLRGCHVDRAF